MDAAATNDKQYELINVQHVNNVYRCTFRPIDWEAFYNKYAFYPAIFTISLNAAIIDGWGNDSSAIRIDEAGLLREFYINWQNVTYPCDCVGVPVPCETVAIFNVIFKQFNDGYDLLAENIFVSADITLHGFAKEHPHNDTIAMIFNVVCALFAPKDPQPLPFKRAVDDAV